MTNSYRFRVSGFILRKGFFGHYGIPHSVEGVESGLVPFLPRQVPITLVDIGASSGCFAVAVQARCGIRAALLVEPPTPALPGTCRAFREHARGNPGVRGVPTETGRRRWTY